MMQCSLYLTWRRRSVGWDIRTLMVNK